MNGKNVLYNDQTLTLTRYFGKDLNEKEKSLISHPISNCFFTLVLTLFSPLVQQQTWNMYSPNHNNIFGMK